MDPQVALQLADAYLSNHELHQRQPAHAIRGIREARNKYNDPNREVESCSIPTHQRGHYHSALFLLLARADIIDRNLHDLYTIFPNNLLDPIIEIIETTRWQFRLTHPTRHYPIYILSPETIRMYTVMLMNAELIYHAINNFTECLQASFTLVELAALGPSLHGAVFRYLCKHSPPLKAHGDHEREMRERIRGLEHNRRRLRAVVRSQPHFPSLRRAVIDVCPLNPFRSSRPSRPKSCTSRSTPHSPSPYPHHHSRCLPRSYSIRTCQESSPSKRRRIYDSDEDLPHPKKPCSSASPGTPPSAEPPQCEEFATDSGLASSESERGSPPSDSPAHSSDPKPELQPVAFLEITLAPTHSSLAVELPAERRFSFMSEASSSAADDWDEPEDELQSHSDSSDVSSVYSDPLSSPLTAVPRLQLWWSVIKDIFRLR